MTWVVESVRRAGALVGLLAWTVRAIVVSSIQVGRDIIVPSPRLVPGIVILPLRCRTPMEVATLSALITLTPGTLTVTVDPDLAELWVHSMYAREPEELRAGLVAVEDRVLGVLRSAGSADR
ncbi:MAG: Na+/H+ antiporter subunit E [Candidatus Nanopelagicales bacterium]